MLRSLGRPIAVIKGVHNNSEARRVDSNTVGGLESCMSLAVGARIVLRANLEEIRRRSLALRPNIVWQSSHRRPSINQHSTKRLI